MMRYEDILMTGVGVRVKQLRQVAGFTQAEMAERMGIGLRAYQRLESGASNMNLTTVARLSEALGVEPAALFTFSSAYRRERRSPTPPLPRRPRP